MKRLYLDVCALCRPYDDQTVLRIRLETDAVYLILEAVRLGRYELVASPVHGQEIGDIKEPRERGELTVLLQEFAARPKCDMSAARARAESFHAAGLGVADAAHLAFAELSADCLVSCDDQFVKRARRRRTSVAVLTPIEFCIREKLL